MSNREFFLKFSDDDEIHIQIYTFFSSLFYSGQTFVHFVHDTLLFNNIYLVVDGDEIVISEFSFDRLEKFYYSISIYRQQKLKSLVQKNDKLKIRIALTIFLYLYRNYQEKINMNVFKTSTRSPYPNNVIEIDGKTVELQLVYKADE